MLCKGGVQRTFSPVNGITHAVNNANHITTTLANTWATFRLLAHFLVILFYLQLNMLMRQRAVVFFLDYSLCICIHIAAPFNPLVSENRITIFHYFYLTTQPFPWQWCAHLIFTGKMPESHGRAKIAGSMEAINEEQKTGRGAEYHSQKSFLLRWSKTGRR